MKLTSLLNTMSLGPNARVLVVPGLSFILLLILFLTVTKTGYTNIRVSLGELNVGKNDKMQLEEKRNTLAEVGAGTIESTNDTMVAVPQHNPSVFALAVIKEYAKKFSIVIKEFELDTKQSEIENVNSVAVVMKIESDNNTNSVIDFVNEIQATLPISNLKTATFNGISTSTMTVRIELYYYFSELPENITAIAGPVKRLSPDESELLREIASYKKPPFISLDPSDVLEREIPFN